MKNKINKINTHELLKSVRIPVWKINKPKVELSKKGKGSYNRKKEKNVWNNV